MIYDGHSYTFPSQLGSAGFEDRAEFMRHLQIAMATHFQPAWRVRDRTPADSSGIADLDAGWSFDVLKECDFRPAGNGRFEWTVDGEVYAKQVMPPSVTDMAYSAEMLVAEMDYAGVDWSLIHRAPYLGLGNDFFADCVRRFPHRLQALAHVEEWLIKDQPDASIARIHRAIEELGLHGLQFLNNHLPLYGQSEEWDSQGFRPFWDAVATLDIPVFFTLSGRHGSGLSGLLAQLQTLRGWMERYPDSTAVLTHGFWWRLFMKPDAVEVPEEVYDAAPIDNPNFHVQLLLSNFLGGNYEYPMYQVRPLIADLVDRLGAGRIMWGTDIPMLLRHHTYRQSIDGVRQCRDFLREQEIDQILGWNAARLMRVA